MRFRWAKLKSITLLLMIWSVLCADKAWGEVQVIINAGIEHQTILGWGTTIEEIEIPEALRDQILREAVNELGLTRVRLEPPRGNSLNNRRWEWLNDDGDPDHINWSTFNTAELDSHVSNWILPFKQLVEANGDPFNLYVSPSFFDSGSTGSVPAWMLNSPIEYAEYAVSLATYLKNNYDMEPDFHCIDNEAGNNNPFTAEVCGKMIRTLGPQFVSKGFQTKIQFPECVTINTSWDYIQTLRNDPLIWPHIGLLSYHLYGGSGVWGSRTNIRDFGIANGIPTAQTEFMNTTVNHIYDDLTLGGVSYWEHYVLAFYGNATNAGDYFAANHNMTSFSRYPSYWDFRQVMHYVRPGAVRLDTSSDDGGLRPLAFTRNGQITLVLLNNSIPYQNRTVNINGLQPGNYGVCHSVNKAAYQELGVHSVGAEGTLTINVTANSVMTIYPHTGINLPPSITDWQATPNYLIQPANSTTLSVVATDPELDALGYAWSVLSQPAGAGVNLASPSSSSTSATGLTVAGEYVFGVTVSDAANVVQREVRLMVHSGNQPPIFTGVHNRLPVLVTLPDNSTELRVEGIDLENDPLSYQWSVVSKPSGAGATLGAPNSNKCRVYSMSMPGDYVFKITMSDPTHSVSEFLTVPVYPVNTAPTISSASAQPGELVPPNNGIIRLLATTGDPDGDVISHYWSLENAPASATVEISEPGQRETQVSGLLEKGTYTFLLTVVDRTKFVTANVNVTVRKYTGDTDNDADVDQEDFGYFQNCISGSGISQTNPACQNALLDDDDDVDLNDFNLFQACMSGANITPNSSCLD